MNTPRPTALIADDEPLLRNSLERLLREAWPELDIVAKARNGREAVEMFEETGPDICFLDVKMPGLSGIEAARMIGDRAHLVFVTAYDQYALKAFEHGVLDYLVKPVEPSRLADTVARLKARLKDAQPATANEALLEQLAAQLERRTGRPTPLRWIRASVGQVIKLIPVDEIDYLRSDQKYTRVAWRGESGQAAEVLIRTPLKELEEKLDPDRFARIHRSVIVNLAAVGQVTRGDNDTGRVHLKGREESLPISSRYLHLFRQM